MRKSLAKSIGSSPTKAVANSSLEKFAETLPKKRGKAVQRGLFPGAYKSIDEAFLEELDSIAKR